MTTSEQILDELTARYPALAVCRTALEELIATVTESYRQGGTFFVAGNGGSGADADHICGELLKGFRSRRPLNDEEKECFSSLWGDEGAALARELQGGLPAVSLLSHPGLNTAWINDGEALDHFAQQLWAQGRAGDVFLAISTGGNSENLRRALMTAKVKQMKTFLLTGDRHGVCEKYAGVSICVPEKETYKIQELHLPIYHAFCAAVESNFWELSC